MRYAFCIGMSRRDFLESFEVRVVSICSAFEMYININRSPLTQISIESTKQLASPTLNSAIELIKTHIHISEKYFHYIDCWALLEEVCYSYLKWLISPTNEIFPFPWETSVSSIRSFQAFGNASIVKCGRWKTKWLNFDPSWCPVKQPSSSPPPGIQLYLHFFRTIWFHILFSVV